MISYHLPAETMDILILGGTGLVPSFVNMGTGMFVHEASILIVIVNGMRLIRYREK